MIPALVLLGALSTYAPGDGHNAGTLACGGRLGWHDRHVAIRGWRGRCGAPALVCAGHRCSLTAVRDSGPWGAQCGRRWRVAIRLPRDCRRRAVVDLAPGLWRELGRPRFLSKVLVVVLRQRREVNRGPDA